VSSIDANTAAALVTSVAEQAQADGVSVSVAIVDEAGTLVAFHRMQTAPRFSADFAIAKARTAAAFSVPTSRLEQLYADRPVFAHSFVAQGGYFLGRGGIPIFQDGSLVAAIGVSGADAHGEEHLATGAIDRAEGLETAAS
jgi:uncharacterized protein GlcG (DUF336 family)